MTLVRFDPDGLEIDVPAGTSLLRAAEKAGAELGSACGGVCACSSCHVYVRAGLGSLSPMEDNESDVLDKAFDVRPSSRLACQARVGAAPVEVEISRESRKTYFDEHPEKRPEGRR